MIRSRKNYKKELNNFFKFNKLQGKQLKLKIRNQWILNKSSIKYFISKKISNSLKKIDRLWLI